MHGGGFGFLRCAPNMNQVKVFSELAQMNPKVLEELSQKGKISIQYKMTLLALQRRSFIKLVLVQDGPLPIAIAAGHKELFGYCRTGFFQDLPCRIKCLMNQTGNKKEFILRLC